MGKANRKQKTWTMCVWGEADTLLDVVLECMHENPTINSTANRSALWESDHLFCLVDKLMWYTKNGKMPILIIREM